MKEPRNLKETNKSELVEVFYPNQELFKRKIIQESTKKKLFIIQG